MKKTISLVLVFAFIFSLSWQFPVFASETSTLEKIPAPDKIRLYNQIKKVGNDLFGVKKTNLVASSTLEKIISLDQVKFFDKVTKIGNDLFGIKKKNLVSLPVMSTALLACISEAIDEKDSSISISFTDAATATTIAIEDRGTCQKTALQISTGKEEALKKCNQNFQLATKTANEKAKRAQQEAWSVYKTDLKACARNANANEIIIEDGGEILK